MPIPPVPIDNVHWATGMEPLALALWRSVILTFAIATGLFCIRVMALDQQDWYLSIGIEPVTWNHCHWATFHCFCSFKILLLTCVPMATATRVSEQCQRKWHNAISPNTKGPMPMPTPTKYSVK